MHTVAGPLQGMPPAVAGPWAGTGGPTLGTSEPVRSASDARAFRNGAGLVVGPSELVLCAGDSRSRQGAETSDSADERSIYRYPIAFGDVHYFGITGHLERRAEHLAKEGTDIEAISGPTNLSRADAKAVKSVLKHR